MVSLPLTSTLNLTLLYAPDRMAESLPNHLDNGTKKPEAVSGGTGEPLVDNQDEPLQQDQMHDEELEEEEQDEEIYGKSIIHFTALSRGGERRERGGNTPLSRSEGFIAKKRSNSSGLDDYSRYTTSRVERELTPQLSSIIESSSSPSTETDTLTWINWFCSLPGHEYFCDVAEDFIEDDFNLTGLAGLVPFYKEAMEMVLDVEPGTHKYTLYSIPR